MAYNVYFVCDRCRNEGLYWTNHTVSYSSCVKYAREMGWRVTKHGWFCPDCQKSGTKMDANGGEKHD